MVKEQRLLEKNSNCKHITHEISLVKFDNCYHFWLFFFVDLLNYTKYIQTFFKKSLIWENIVLLITF